MVHLPIRQLRPLVLGGCLLASGACEFGGAETPKENPPRPVETTPVVVRPVEVTVDAVGSLTAIQSVDLRTQKPGLVRQLHDLAGGRVLGGDLLLQLDDRQAAAQVKLARANVAEADATLRQNKRAHERMGELRGEGVASEQSGDDALASLEQARAARDVARARLVVAESDLADTTIKAPFSGHLGRWRVDKGAYVQAGEILNRLTDDSTLEVRFSVPERIAGALAVGQEIRLDVSSHPDQRFVGRLAFIEPEIDTGTRSAQAIGTFTNAGRLLRPGQFARVELLLSTRPAGLVVPVGAVRNARDKYYVFVIEGTQAIPREVVLGIRLGEWREILEGLAAGDTVVQNGHTTLDLAVPSTVRRVTLEDTRP